VQICEIRVKKLKFSELADFQSAEPNLWTSSP